MKTQPGGAFLAGGTGDQRKLRRPTQLPGTGKYVIMLGTKLECSGELAAADFFGNRRFDKEGTKNAYIHLVFYDSTSVLQ